MNDAAGPIVGLIIVVGVWAIVFSVHLLNIASELRKIREELERRRHEQ